MTDPGRYFDPDPRPRRSPRLYATVEDVRGSVAPVSMRLGKPTKAETDRLRRELGVYTLIMAGWTPSMVAKLLGMTPRGVRFVQARALRRKSRV